MPLTRADHEVNELSYLLCVLDISKTANQMRRQVKPPLPVSKFIAKSLASLKQSARNASQSETEDLVDGAETSSGFQVVPAGHYLASRIEALRIENLLTELKQVNTIAIVLSFNI